jgi:hypothetical protein
MSEHLFYAFQLFINHKTLINMAKPNYNCSQQSLYAVCRSGWASCTTYLADFAAAFPNYTAPMIAGMIADIDAAEALGDEEQRTEDSRSLRVDLKNKANEAMEQWQLLKRYITKAYPADQVEIKPDAAGQSHYAKSLKYDWGAVGRLLTDGVAFATANTADLTAGNIMPAGFPAAFTTSKVDYDALYASYVTASQTDEVETQTKIEANNGIYASLMQMFRDGQLIFKKNEAVKKLFTFEQVLLNIDGPGNQGIKGDVTIQGTNNPVTVGEVSFTGPSSKSVEIDEDGHYECPQLAAGLYTMLVTAPGFSGVTFNDIEVETGIMKTIDVELTPAT